MLDRLRALKSTRVEPNISFPFEKWEDSLKNHKDSRFYEYIKNGNRNGYKIGIKKDSVIDKNGGNLPCNLDEKIAITEWIIKCIEEKGNIFGPFEDKEELKKYIGCEEDVAIAPMGAVPKEVDVAGTVLSHRVITHLSAPRKGASVNSYIDEKEKEVKYVKFKEIVKWMKKLGNGAVIWTADAKDAYLRVPTHKED